MNDLKPAIGDATRTENIGAKLAASELFGATLGTAGGNSAYGAPHQPEDGAQTAEQPQGEQVPAAAAPTPQEPAEPRHVVPGVGGVPEHIKAPQKNPFDALADLLGHPTR